MPRGLITDADIPAHLIERQENSIFIYMQLLSAVATGIEFIRQIDAQVHQRAADSSALMATSFAAGVSFAMPARHAANLYRTTHAGGRPMLPGDQQLTQGSDSDSDFGYDFGYSSDSD